MYAAGDTEGGDKEIKRLARINRRQHVLTDNKLTVTVPVSVSKNAKTVLVLRKISQNEFTNAGLNKCMSRFTSYVPPGINFAI